MKIRCIKCEKYLGEIIKAKLRKKITFLCKECTSILIKPKVKNENKNDFFNIFGEIDDLFKDIFKSEE